MCGIAGYIGPRELSPDVLAQTLASMRRRGPDHAAVRDWRRRDGSRVYLLHARLNIIDLDPRSNQPMGVGSQWIAYNGELYNYVELRAALEKTGARFRTASDTEVMLTGLAAQGVDWLDRCEGMWAFATYDEASGAVRLVRDRFGEKPLYVLEDETGLYFGSEVKFLRALRGARLVVNQTHLRRYLVNGYKALYKTSATFFENVREVAAATVECHEPGGARRTHRYWTLGYQPDESLTYDAAVNGVRERLVEAVRLRLRADVPLAFCLSGGVDSNALIGIAKRVFGYDVHGFTVANTDARYNESELVDAAVAAQELRHTWVNVGTTDFLTRLRTLVEQHDAPVYTISYYVHWRMAAGIAEQGYRVSISGTGADELFSGYYDHHNLYLQEVSHDQDLFDRSLADWKRTVEPIVRNPYLRDPLQFIKNPSSRAHIFLDAHEFSTYLKDEWFEPFAEEFYTDSPLRNRMLNELRQEAVPVSLHEDDLNSMYFSIENRSPFLDRTLAEFAYSIPTRHLVQRGLRKAVLRDAVKNVVPEAILGSPRKVGFNAPIMALLDSHDRRVRELILDDGPVFDIIDRDRMSTLLETSGQLPNSVSKFLFYFVSAKLFLEVNSAA